MATTASGVNRFQLDGSKYDQTTYFGRVRGFLDLIDPRTLLTSDEELAVCWSILVIQLS
jgi:hypothetical protein